MSVAETSTTVISLRPAPIIEAHSSASATSNKDSLVMVLSAISIMQVWLLLFHKASILDITKRRMQADDLNQSLFYNNTHCLATIVLNKMAFTESFCWNPGLFLLNLELTVERL